MCSISGYVAWGKPNLNFIQKSWDLMRHRGPDFEDKIEIENLCLAHQRLAIIDLDKRSNQPFHIGGNYITFNGEIYNYKDLSKKYLVQDTLNTKSDTEVLLKLLIKKDIKVLNEINGMFAFAWYNPNEEKLTLVRDRFGVKPLYFTVIDECFYFSSEIKPLVAIQKQFNINTGVITEFWENSATDFDEFTFAEGVYQVKAGHYIEIDVKKSKDIQQKRWYFFEDFKIDTNRLSSFNNATEYYEELLTDAVNIRMIADVPVAITLSGGLDSTCIYTMIKDNLKKNIQAFTFNHSQNYLDETNLVKTLVRSYGDELLLIPNDMESSWEFYINALKFLEFPIWSNSFLAYFKTYQTIKKAGFTVILEGHGADEQLGGYTYLVKAAMETLLRDKKYYKAWQVALVLNFMQNNKPYLQLIRDFVYILRKQQFYYDRFEVEVRDSFDYKILPIILRCFDRMSMANSVESRSPFMDYRLVEISRHFPTEFFANSLGSKAILRNILKKHKLDFIFKHKKKTGFASQVELLFNNKQNISIVREILKNVNLNFLGLDKIDIQINIQNLLSKKEWDRSDAIILSKITGLSLIKDFYEKLNKNNVV